MKLFFVDCYRNCLKVFNMDIKKGTYIGAWSINSEQNTKDAVLSLISLVVHNQPNQVIIDTTGLGLGVKEHFDSLISKVDFIKKDEQGNMKYVKYMSAEEMEMFIKRVANDGE